MTAPQPAPAPHGPTSAGRLDTPFHVRRAYRDADDVWVGGVAAGIAHHLGVPAWWVRMAFVALGALGGFGVLCYAALWMCLPAGQGFAIETPGEAAATRTGRRPGAPRKPRDIAPLAALAALGLGVAIFAQVVFGRGSLFWPMALGLVGVSVLWRQADEAQRERWRDTGSRIDPVRALLGGGGRAAVVRIVAGVGLIVLGMAAFGLRSGSLGVARDVLIASGLSVAGIGLTIGPLIVRLAADLTAERAERVRSQERADLAAHLHDSVLQTLALIQKNSHDPATVATLARGQERDLRSWLFEEPSQDGETLAAALKAMAAEIDTAYSLAVDLVTVGDRPVDESLRPLVRATREAVTNAAKHAGADRVDVYAEASAQRVEVFVRDRGSGFDVAAVPDDRHGVRGSILDRMRRHGGEAEIRSGPEGTEVRLTMSVHATAPAETTEPAETAEPAETTEPAEPTQPVNRTKDQT